MQVEVYREEREYAETVVGINIVLLFFLLGHVLDTQIHAEFFTVLLLPFYIHSRIHPRPTPLVCWPNMALHTAQVCSAPRGGGRGGTTVPSSPAPPAAGPHAPAAPLGLVRKARGGHTKKHRDYFSEGEREGEQTRRRRERERALSSPLDRPKKRRGRRRESSTSSSSFSFSWRKKPEKWKRSGEERRSVGCSSPSVYKLGLCPAGGVSDDDHL